MEEPRSLKEKEYKELLEFLERAYDHSHEYFPRFFPQVYKKDTIQYENKFIIKVDEKIVCHVGLSPFTLLIGNEKLKVAGIGGVATDPEYRRKGLMAQLLNYTVKKITQEGYHLSVLWGDRQRYNYFGWEIAGRSFTFRITRRSLEKFVSTQVIPSIRVKRYQGDQQEMNDVIVFHHEKEPLRVERSQQEYQLLLEKTGVVSYIAFGEGTSNRDKSAYFIFRGENVPTEVLEFGGEPLIFLGLLRYIFSKFEIASLDFSVPYYSTTHPSTSSLFPYLLEIASTWSVNPFCQVKIIDLYSTLGVLLPIIQEKLCSSGILLRNKEFNITLKMSESGQKATLVLRGDKIEVTNRQSPTTVEITELKMVKLLFGTFPATIHLDLKLEPDYSQFLETIFPIDFYIWPLDHI